MKKTLEDARRELAALVEHVSYKPGWSFSCRFDDDDQECVTVNIQARLPCSRRPGREVTLFRMFTADLRSSHLLEDFPQRLFDQVARMELHEAEEWFTVDGVRPLDPHKQRVKV